MMLISKTIRQKLTVLAVGSSLFAGCSSGPQLSSIRFWPGAEKVDSAADDEAVARKWRERLNASAQSSGYGAAPGFETAQAEEQAAKPRSSRFNIFRRFSRNQETEAPQTTETAADVYAEQQQRLALERRIAQLEAEQRALQQRRTAAETGPARPAAYDPRRDSPTSDPFLTAAQMNPTVPQNQTTAPQNQTTAPQKQIVRPAIRPAPRPPAADAGLPSWAQASEQNATAPRVSSAKDVAVNPRINPSAPGFGQTPNNTLDAAAEQQAHAEPPQGKAPALPLDVRPAITPSGTHPFARVEPQTPAATPAVTRRAPAMPDKPQPKPARPAAEPVQKDQLASLRSVEDQQRAWAELQVRQLLKRARIQARAGQLNEALNTAVAAEQLANSADVEFSNREQTPAQLVSLIRLKADEIRSSKAPHVNAPKTVIAAGEPRGNPIVEPAAPPRIESQKVSTKNVAPPQWPGRTAALQPHQATDDRHPLVSSPGGSKPSVADRTLKTAEFVNPRPAQSVQPRATTSDQWYSPDNHPLRDSSETRGSYMEAPPVARRSPSEINAQFVSSKSIYSPENLQWTSLDAARATIVVDRPVPAPPVPLAPSAGRQPSPPPFEDELRDAEPADPFADVFDETEVSDTLLSSDDPLSQFAPAIPDANPAASLETSPETLLFGIPVRKLALVLLAGLILLAAIVHRRRTSELHEL